MTGAARVVIIGGGFGGLHAAQALDDAPVEVTLIDRRNHHVFQPLLYQVATAGLNPADIAYPIRSVLRRQKNVTVLLGEVTEIDKAARVVHFAEGSLPYDLLVVAAGATHSYFGHDDWEKFAPGLKTIEDATEVRARLLYAFEAAEREPDPVRRRAWLTFVVIGGGATGVEIAGALAEVAKLALAADFRRIDPTQARVLLVEGGPRILGTYPEKLQQSAREQLEELGVEVHTGAQVTGIDDSGVTLAAPLGGTSSDGTNRIASYTKVWGAGVKASPLGKLLGAPTDRAGRVLVTPTLRLPDHPEIYVIGDLASLTSNGKPVPGVAPAAMQMGDYTADSIRRHVDPTADHHDEPFAYVDKGSLATIGRKRAVADLPGNLQLSGFLAWAAWLFIHIIFLIGFRNRILVLVEWFWAYITFQRGARLITHEPSRTLPHPPPP